jgi:dienelactone hydrolase
VKEITHELNNYADVIHHSPAIDLQILIHLAAGDGLVRREAPTASLERLKAQVEVYRTDNVER